MSTNNDNQPQLSNERKLPHNLLDGFKDSAGPQIGATSANSESHMEIKSNPIESDPIEPDPIKPIEPEPIAPEPIAPKPI